MRRCLPVGLALGWIGLGGLAAFAQAPVTVSESQGVELTVYNSDLGLVKDRRALSLREGMNTVRFAEVAAQIDPTSVHFASLTAPEGAQVLEQSYQYDLVNRQKLLEKYLGREIGLIEVLGDEVRPLEGTLLSAEEGVLTLQTADGIVVTSAPHIRLPRLPDGLIIKPTLEWLVGAGQAGEHQVEVSYLTQGINWRADYVAVANADDTRIDLNGWVTIDNRSGATYPDARLKLVAGEVHRVQPPPPMPMAAVEARAERMGAAAPQFEEQAFFEYHLYTLQRTTTVRDNETRQVELLSAAGVPVKKVFVFDPRQPQFSPRRGAPEPSRVQVMLELRNRAEDNLGMPLPKGRVRVYKADPEGSLQFVGEDEIDHTPRDEEVRLLIGEAFDVVAEHSQTDHRVIADRVWEDSYEVKLRNHKDERVTVTVVQPLWGDWEVLQSSHEARKKDARTLEFDVPVDPGQEVTVRYRVRTRW